MSLRAGDLEVHAIVATRFRLDGGAIFGVVPKAVWSRARPADAENCIPLVARVLVVDHPRAGYRAVVDAGLGDVWSPKETTNYGLDGVALEVALAAHGFAPDSVTDLVLTHLHWDHAGGLSTRADGADPNAAPRRALPRARLHVGTAHRDYAREPSWKDRGSFRASDLAFANDAGVRSITDGEVLPGIFAQVTEGHTTGLWVLSLGSRRDPAVAFPADLLPMEPHVRPSWGMAYDNHAAKLVEEKLVWLEQWRAAGTCVVLEHDPDVTALRIDRDGDRWSSTRDERLTDAVRLHAL